MSSSTQQVYEKHHLEHRESGFSIMEVERGVLLKHFFGKGKRVLDIGCRDGALTKYFAESNEVLGIDIDTSALGEARVSLGIEIMNIDLNGNWQELADRKFDVVTAGEILEHLYYPEEVILKVKKHLKEGGLFVGSVPNAFSFKNRLRYLLGQKKYTPLSDPTHINQFSYLELQSILKKHFKYVEIIGLGRYHKLSKWFPNAVAFDLFFRASN